MVKHKFYGPNGIEVNFEEFVRILSKGPPNAKPLTIRAKPQKKRKKRKAHRYR